MKRPDRKQLLAMALLVAAAAFIVSPQAAVRPPAATLASLGGP